MTSIFPQCFVIHVIDLGLAGFVSVFLWVFFTPFENNTIQDRGFLYFRSKYEFGENFFRKVVQRKK